MRHASRVKLNTSVRFVLRAVSILMCLISFYDGLARETGRVDERAAGWTGRAVALPARVRGSGFNCKGEKAKNLPQLRGCRIAVETRLAHHGDEQSPRQQRLRLSRKAEPISPRLVTPLGSLRFARSIIDHRLLASFESLFTIHQRRACSSTDRASDSGSEGWGSNRSRHANDQRTAALTLPRPRSG